MVNPVGGESGDLRLLEPSGGGYLIEGNDKDGRYVEGGLFVYHDDEWGTICSASFDYLDGNVACHQLGYHDKGKP